MIERAHVWVSGRVQGVNFRWSASQRARSLGVAGWVRNLPDGRVEAVFEGRPEAVASMVEWCTRGPRMARVDDVDVRREEPEGHEGFGRPPAV